ncbi:hypothetical protein FHX15_003574 [Rhizobium sp. BK650]|nr:hypothetical protein [Rhizobium sp. BK650]
MLAASSIFGSVDPELKGIDVIPSNDFSLYDHVLDTAVMVGAVPAAYGWQSGPVSLDAGARERLTEWQLWINPDCGLKTHKWEEVRPALVNIVAAAKALRAAGPIRR